MDTLVTFAYHFLYSCFLQPRSGTGGSLIVPFPTPTFSEAKTQRKISERRAAKGRPGRPEQPSGPRAPRMEAGEPWEVDLEEPFFWVQTCYWNRKI